MYVFGFFLFVLKKRIMWRRSQLKLDTSSMGDKERVNFKVISTKSVLCPFAKSVGLSATSI